AYGDAGPAARSRFPGLPDSCIRAAEPLFPVCGRSARQKEDHHAVRLFGSADGVGAAGAVGYAFPADDARMDRREDDAYELARSHAPRAPLLSLRVAGEGA